MGVLRLLLAVAVFLFHACNSSIGPLTSVSGRAAVFCFFVVSGYYVEMILSERYTKSRLGSGATRAFYLARYIRLFPTYLLATVAAFSFAALGLGVEIPAAMHWHANQGVVSTFRTATTWFASLTMVGLNLVSVQDLILPPTWSLGVEISFYALAPQLLRQSNRTMIGVALAGLILQFMPYGQHSPLLFGAPFFLLGAIVRRHQATVAARLKWIQNLPVWAIYVLLLSGVLFSLPQDLYIGRQDPHILNSVDLFVYPILVALIIPSLHEKTKSSRLDFLVGQLSYPFYLTHQLAIGMGRHAGDISPAVMLIGALFSASVLVALEMHFVEPWRKRISEPKASRSCTGVATASQR